MKLPVYKTSFNNEVVKSLTKEQFLEQHPDDGKVWDDLHKEEPPEKEKVKEEKKK